MSDDKPDWPTQATTTIVKLVDDVKYKTTRPATMATRAVVYGIVILALGVPALIMFLVGLVHFLNQAIDGDVWIVYAILGSIFTLAGMFLWRKRTG